MVQIISCLAGGVSTILFERLSLLGSVKLRSSLSVLGDLSLLTGGDESLYSSLYVYDLDLLKFAKRMMR